MIPSLAVFLLSLSLASASPVLVPRVAGDTQNDLTNGSGCKAMTVIFARGTTETGNVGTLTGPPFFAALDKAMGAGQVAVQGVEYPADIPGFLAGGDKTGSAKMASLVTQALADCPDTKVVMSGYSQGGQLVHNAATMLGASASKVSSAIIFGDPNNGKAVGSVGAAKTKVFCNATDNICQGGTLILQAHLIYSANAGDAAAFAKTASGL